MNREMLNDQISQLQTDINLLRKKLRFIEPEYNELVSICAGIYYARIAMDESKVLQGLDKIDAFFREENMN